ncbi:(d)CMP kinase [bacterium]|nr:(d)CMP kinase [bacterium]
MIITIDGPAGAGKSTVARRLAERIGFELLDTGAMYRAVTLAARRADIAPDDDPSLDRLLHQASIDLLPNQIRWAGEDITLAIRTPEVTAAIQGYADNPLVRRLITARTRELAQGRDVVTEGRDQGSEVFPDADRKFFVTASDQVRAERRHGELVGKGINITFEEVLESQKRRDDQDARRPVGKLICPSGAIIIDASDLSEEDVLAHLLSHLPTEIVPPEATDPVRSLAQQFLGRGDPTGWFDALYRSAGRDTSKIPWADRRPNEHLLSWLDRERIMGDGKRALVVGCGLGDDAHRLAGIGFEVVAFDLAPTAIEWARERFGNENPRYDVVDLFDPPAEYTRAFDFVFEAYTWQALPTEIRFQAIQRVADFVAPGGELLVICRARDEGTTPTGPPWPLARSEFDPLLQAGLAITRFEDFVDREGIRRFRLLLQRP